MVNEPRKDVISSADRLQVKSMHDMLEGLRALGRRDGTHGLVLEFEEGEMEVTKQIGGEIVIVSLPKP